MLAVVKTGFQCNGSNAVVSVVKQLLCKGYAVKIDIFVN